MCGVVATLSEVLTQAHTIGFPAYILVQLMIYKRSFGGLEVACWPLVHKYAGSHLAEAFEFLGRKNPQHAVGPMS
jgi:hypothetical protein